MTSEPSMSEPSRPRPRPKSKWCDLESNNELRELAESHHAVLVRNISQGPIEQRMANENGSPKQSKTKVKKSLTLPSSPTVSEQVLELERALDPEPESGPSSKKVVSLRPRGKCGTATYTFNRDKLPGLVARAKEFVKKWHEPKLPKNSVEEQKRTMREKCNSFTIHHSRADKDCIHVTNPLYIAMEFRKSLIRHDWAGVKKLLKVLLRNPFREDRITWKMILTTLYYYPGAEAALREYIERSRNAFGGSEILRGLLEINGMEPYTYSRSKKLFEQEDLLSAVPAGSGDGKRSKKKSKKKDDDDVVEVAILDGSEDSN